jgi:hypothetical protein
LSTVEITARNKERVIEEFADYYGNTIRNGSGEYKNFIVKKSSNPDKAAQLMRYLIDQNIMVRAAANSSRTNGYDFKTGKEGRVSIEEGDYVITTNQPQGTLVRVLFEPNPELVDSLTYDLTAWETHYAYGVDGFAVKGDVEMTGVQMETFPMDPTVEKPYAYLAKWNSFEDMKFLGHLFKMGINARYSEVEFTMNGETYKPGTLIITRTGNEALGDKFDGMVKDAAALMNRALTPVSTGFVDTGSDFGSSSVRFIDAPRIAVLSGDGVSSNSLGFIWHFFDQELEYPISLVNRDDMRYADMSKYDVLILPSGSYGGQIEAIRDWVRDGGTLIAMEGANRFLAGQDGFNLKVKRSENEEDDSPESKLVSFGESRRGSAAYINAGSVYEIQMDNTHPLAFGYDDTYMSLKLGSTAYEYLDNGYNYGATRSGEPRSGFVGHKAQENLEESLTFGAQRMGSGTVIYMIDNPLYRGFWHNGKLLIGNAVFLR